MTVRSLQAEYLLKSAVNIARVIIANDVSPEDAEQDIWGMFSQGMVVDPALLGITEPNIRVSLEIRPEGAKIPVRALVPVAGREPDKRWRGVFVRLFQSLGFDDDEEKDHTGFFNDRFFNSEEMVAALVDYMDKDEKDYAPDDFVPGIESQLPKGYFPNTRMRRVGELATIPGFTPARVQRLIPFLTVFDNNRININLAPALVLKSLHEDITDDQVQEIISFRKGDQGPFTEPGWSSDLSDILGEDIFRSIFSFTGIQSNWFQILAKVDYSTSVYFMRAYLSKSGNGELPKIRSVELF